ncbi:GNAT family N-acyltransferase [Thalassospiraceae bacterium LMO-SO8]|nr:GNAT family N-acetyltransferase [Alphaproteobacteria bacterium LMO-S08]WND76992.1 GNAT family N-acyltransferase [Thalassospiraceae bacterium LMO-SO8]
MNMLAKLAVPIRALPKFAHSRRAPAPPAAPRPVDVHARNLEIRLAETPEEIEAAQRLRYNVFYREMGAIPTVDAARHERDADPFDDVCDHLLVLDTDRSQPGRPFVCGTYRLIRGAVAKANGGFYSAHEYDLTALLRHEGELVELGRSCVHEDYRTGAVMQLLWRGIAEYLAAYDIKLMFGCGSLPGTDAEALMPALSYLHHFHMAPSDIRARALDDLYVKIDRVPLTRLDQRAARAMLPPLIKGYMRVGGFIGDGAVIDNQFNTTDVCIIVPTDHITEKYLRHYKPCGTR